MQIDDTPLPSNLDYPQRPLDLGQPAPSGELGTCCISFFTPHRGILSLKDIFHNSTLIFTYQIERIQIQRTSWPTRISVEPY